MRTREEIERTGNTEKQIAGWVPEELPYLILEVLLDIRDQNASILTALRTINEPGKEK